MKILVIDSCDRSRASAGEALRELTNVAIHASVATLDAAMGAFAGAEVVITDAELPDGDYFDVISAAQQRTPNAAIVVFSKRETPDLGRRTIAAGADFYLPQSAGFDELQRAVLHVAPRIRRRRDSSSDRLALLGRLTAGVAHDLANYLGAVDSAIALAQRRATDASIHDDLARARRAAAASLNLLGTLVDYARGGAPKPAQVDLPDLTAKMLDLFGRAVPDNVRVVVDVAADVPSIRGVAPELEQLVLNLLLNAGDAMPDGGELRIGIAFEDGRVRLEVADRGGGLADAYDGDAVSRSSKTARAGGGLGLGIVRAIVDRHGALLRILHRAGGGSRVQITFEPAR